MPFLFDTEHESPQSLAFALAVSREVDDDNLLDTGEMYDSKGVSFTQPTHPRYPTAV